MDLPVEHLATFAAIVDEGSFEVDTIEWRTRHVLGAQTGAAEFTYCSLGS